MEADEIGNAQCFYGAGRANERTEILILMLDSTQQKSGDAVKKAITSYDLFKQEDVKT